MAPAKWTDPALTAKGQTRATVAPATLETLWVNTGTLCNIECARCYIESSPKNDRLEYLRLPELLPFLEEARALGAREIGFTGGEPFLNPELLAMASESLARGFEVLILTNAMAPMALKKDALLALRARHGARLRLRVSLDDHRERVHDEERGAGAFQKTLAGLRWLLENGFSPSVAARSFSGEEEESARAGFRALLGRELPLVIFPEMGAGDPPEISTACWGILEKSPDSVMCARSRMLVKRRGQAPSLAACTLLPYDERFAMGSTLREAWRPVSLLHPHCATFCVLGGASCST